MKLKRKVALITATGRGRGREIALAFAQEGAAARSPAPVAPDGREPQGAELPKVGTVEAMAITGMALDLATALEAAQTLSSDITLDRLLETMMALVIEHTGAQRGVFLREHDGRWLIVVRRDVDPGGFTSLAPVPLDAGEEVSRGIIQYVQRTGEVVCIDDAGSDERFAADPYILRQQPKSIVCLPILNQAKLLGILYTSKTISPPMPSPRHGWRCCKCCRRNWPLR